ncbi:MAG: ribosomal protein [Desulfomicrobiaceae bacterium]|jgi:small subunit ribosomal protein S8|nr:ribosomal protein [Desulfomicrobiaceae bacterium]
MAVVDPIADLLTRIRNAHMARHTQVAMSPSRMRESILTILQEEGFIEQFEKRDDQLVVRLKYHNQKPVISGLRRVSKPGRRVYVPAAQIPSVQNGLGICILSTSQGVMEGKHASAKGIGGELICEIW